MTKDGPDDRKHPDPAAERKARAARALRDNLRRRKAQARAREEPPAPPRREPGASD